MIKQISFLLILALCCVGCSPLVQINTETSPGSDFSKYKSYNFYQLSAQGDTITKGFAERVDLLKKAIATEMERRGFQSTQNKPDLLINIGIAVEERVQTRQTNFLQDGAPYYVGQRNYKWKSQDIEVGRYRDGTVTIHLVDTKINEMIWRGTAEGVLPGSTEKLPNAIQKAITALFNKFPVAIKQ